MMRTSTSLCRRDLIFSKPEHLEIKALICSSSSVTRMWNLRLTDNRKCITNCFHQIGGKNIDVLPDFFDLFSVRSAGMIVLGFPRQTILVGFGELTFQIQTSFRFLFQLNADRLQLNFDRVQTTFQSGTTLQEKINEFFFSAVTWRFEVEILTRSSSSKRRRRSSNWELIWFFK